MTSDDWSDRLSERDRKVITAAGYDERGASSWDTRGVGDSPLLLVVDMQRFIVGDDVPIFEAVEESNIAIGEEAWDAMESIEPFVDLARDHDVPVTFTRVVPPRYDDPDHPDLRIVDELAPQDDEGMLDKSYASAFHGTDLVSRLVRAGIDTVFVVGNTTSGCLRATVVDAQQYGFKVVVPKECVFDRLHASHSIALLDMWMKYANVVEVDEARDLLIETASETG